MNLISTPNHNPTSPLSPNHHRELEAIVGESGIYACRDIDPIDQNRIFQSITAETPVNSIIYPNNQAELAAVIAYAKQHQLGILPCGNRSKLRWGGLVKNVNLVVSTQRLNQLIEHAVGDLTVTIEAGMSFTQLQQILAETGQFLALDPAYSENATIGGIIATGDTGSLRQRYRGVRDQLLGVSFVRSDGKIAKAGGRVVKNVAGYDLMKLLTGSYGTLGIISQITLRVYPVSPASQTVLLTGNSTEIATAKQTLLSSALTPVAVDLLSPQLMEKLNQSSEMGLIVRFQSLPESVEQQASRLLEVGEKLGLKGERYTQDDDRLWQQLKQLIWQPDESPKIICKIGVTPTEAVATLNECQALGFIHAGVGLGVLRWETVHPEHLLKLRNWCNNKGGFLSILDAPPDFKQQLEVWGYNGNALDLMRRIKQQFDPQNLFSPHRFVGDI
ncbi:FAD-binding oxidoreductase [Limnoraphis robusta]|uniref:FAD-binding oxidoreductase n=1 Tax=Limnoraphis robusta CCNP1315 TaxID=3110306 RepID=A0ABU5U7G4_9CYAN|nr:FAD-binding oxidoreductase [Limnoraphis robusta]MEA5523109.1 FAD-binding oxidoreductase [Limnoraphis robusta CCNP1315]MEA5548097.1 FAD-binding oxidoreductase [Limnoraphis robusta CCNP1324]